MMAQYEPGYMYSEDIGRQRNYVKLLECLHQSALQGYNIAIDEIAIVARNGLRWPNKTTVNSSMISTITHEQRLSYEREKDLSETPKDKTIDTEAVTADISNKDIIQNEPSDEIKEVVTLTRYEDFPTENNTPDDQSKVYNTITIPNEVTDEVANKGSDVMQSTTTTHQEPLFYSSHDVDNDIYFSRNAHFKNGIVFMNSFLIAATP